MDVDARSWLQQAGAPTEAARVLLHLPESDAAESLIEVAVKLARNSSARIRGLSVVDTHALRELVTCEAAGYAVSELQRLQIGSLRRNEVRALFSRLCLEGGLDFDLYRKQGSTLELLSTESQAHDLSIALIPPRQQQDRAHLQLSDAMSLLHRATSPWLIVRAQAALPQRVLLVQDGTAASMRAIRSFTRQRLLPDAAVRLLAIAPTARQAQSHLHAGLDLVRPHFPGCEMGCATGRPSQLVPDYARHWEADLVVLGAIRDPSLASYWFGQPVSTVLEQTNCALFATA